MENNEKLAIIRDQTFDILQRALAGYTDDYKLVEQGMTYIRWGEVQEDIRALFDAPDVKAVIVEENRAMRDALASIEDILVKEPNQTAITRLLLKRARVGRKGTPE